MGKTERSGSAAFPKAELLLLLLLGALVAAGLYLHFSDATTFTFARPWALLLLSAAPLTFYTLIVSRHRRTASLRFSSIAALARLRRGLFSRIAALPAILEILAVTLIALALAQLQSRNHDNTVEVEGIEIVLALDLSVSMRASDLRPNRLEAAKKVIDEFISRRSGDRIGLVVFAREAYTHCPLTLDYGVLRTMLGELNLGLIDGAATAIGNALGVSLARLRNSDAKSRVVILLTDGENNAGNVTPRQAARYAAAMKIKVFTVLMGPSSSSGAIQRDAFGRRIRILRQHPVNPKLLREIAEQTGGQSFLATDREALEQNFQRILDELDKSTRRDVGARLEQAYRPFVITALGLVLLAIALRLTRFRQLP